MPDPSPIPYTAPGAVVPRARWSLKKKLLVALGVVVLAIVGIISMALSLTSAPTEAARSFVAELSAGRTEAAYDSTGSMFREATSADAFAAFLASYPVLTQPNDVTFNSRSVVNDEAKISGTVSAGETSSPIIVKLVKEDGKWVVIGLSLDPADVDAFDD